ncbi:MAG: DUF5717 family protein, partial [Lachnospiraceae bacterium]|nr:DUF5717 family protein [Lachnospiraceae bacterium]
KIQDMISGTFEYDRPSLFLEEEKLDFAVVENETYSGSFSLKSSTEEPVRGIVTCEHPAICILTPEFDAAAAEIRFDFSSDLATEGETEEGTFVVTSSSGEYLFPFSARISRHYPDSSIGRIKTVNDFTNLCKLNWEEALRIFSSRYFCNIFHENSEYETLVYRAFTRNRHTSHEMEEFLIAAGRKKRSVISVDNPERTYVVRDSAIHAAVDVEKSEWGYVSIRISCEEPFLTLGKKHLQTSDFTGKHAEFDFRIDPERMHGGKNYAVITLESGFQTERMVLTCICKGRQPDQMRLSFVSEDDLEGHSYAWKKRRCYYLLEKSFFAYNLGTKPESEWIPESIHIIQQAETAEIQGRWLNLFLAYFYWKAKDTDRMTDRMLSVPRNTRTARTPLGAMYLYLQTLNDPQENREEAFARIRAIYAKYRSHPILNWVMLQMDESLLRNPQRRYQWIRQYMTTYSDSPIFYLEVAKVLQAYPEILNSQDDFDFHLICWMSRKNLINRELSVRIQGMTQGKRSFHRNYFLALGRCYKKFQDDSFVRTICVYLINTSRYGEAFFPWFQRGVEQHLKIAGLYEAYMLSWSRSMGELPPEIVRYFSMNSTLPARRKAMLFAYVVRNKNRLQKDWPAYMVLVKNFALSELSKGHMNDDLAVIYEELRRRMPVGEWNQIKRDAENCYKVTVGERKVFSVQAAQGRRTVEELTGKCEQEYAGNALTAQRNAGSAESVEKWRGEDVRTAQNSSNLTIRRTPVSGDHAYIYLYHRPYVILYEGADGLLYVSIDGSRVSKALPGNSLLGSDRNGMAEEKPAEGNHLLRSDGERLQRMEGSIDEMTDLLMAARDREFPVVAAAQQLMIRMLFTGYLGERHEEVFQILQNDAESEELLQAYVSTLSRSFMLSDYPLPGTVYHFIGDRLIQNKRMNAWCVTAFTRMHLRYREEKYDGTADRILKKSLIQGDYFPFYSELSDEKKRRYLLIGICVISYQEREKQTFYVELPDGTREVCREVLPGWYTYPLSVLPGEVCAYRIVDVSGQTRVSESIRGAEEDTAAAGTRYEKLGQMGDVQTDRKAQYEYTMMSDMVNVLFTPIKE